MQCQIQNHSQKKIITVCMDKQCKQQRLCCVICINEYHSNHLKQIIEIDEIHQSIEQESNRQDNSTQHYSYGQNQIIESLEQLKTLIDSLQKKIREEIEIQKNQNLQEYLKKNFNKQQGIQQWNGLLENILKYVEIQNCQLTITKQIEGQLNQLEEQYIKNIKKYEESLQAILQKINNPQKLTVKLCFKENRKHADIAIIDNCTIKKTKSVQNIMAFADEGFDPSIESYEFAFNIQIVTDWVAIGIGNEEAIKANSYKMDNFRETGHAQYMITHHNYTFHHTDVEINHKPRGMNFKNGDKIQIRYDHFTKSLEFRKQQNQTSVKMSITDLSKRLYPCVWLYSENEQVQLVEYGLK